VGRHAGLQAETVGARYGFHRAGTDVRLLELLGLASEAALHETSDVFHQSPITFPSFLAFSSVICHFFVNASEFLRG
jgi:hypothetical protein